MQKNHLFKIRMLSTLALVAAVQMPRQVIGMDLSAMLRRVISEQCVVCKQRVYSNDHTQCITCRREVHPNCCFAPSQCLECLDITETEVVTTPPQTDPAVTAHACVQPAPAPAVTVVNPRCPTCLRPVISDQDYLVCDECGQAVHMNNGCSQPNYMLCIPCDRQVVMRYRSGQTQAQPIPIGMPWAMPAAPPTNLFAALAIPSFAGPGYDNNTDVNHDLPQCGLCADIIWPEERRIVCSNPDCHALIHETHMIDHGQTECVQCGMDDAQPCATCDSQIPHPERQNCSQCQRLAHAACLDDGVCGKCRQREQAAHWWESRTPTTSQSWECPICTEEKYNEAGITVCCQEKLCHTCYAAIRREDNLCPYCRKRPDW